MRGGLVCLAAACLSVLLFPPVRAQESSARREVHYGAGSCAAQACHGGASADRQEYKTWATKDKHAKAYDILENDLGQRIGQRLGLKPTESARCLNCHGTTGVQTAETFDPHDGVSCELCHGGAKEWLGPHAAPDWLRKNPAQKAEFGYRDLTTAARRTAMCAECHVGGTGRDITHDIMAAGHPPLVFDAAKFLADMPPHWKKRGDRLETWIEGQQVSARAHLGHVARVGSDFTSFDCSSCHHRIYTGSVYEQADPPGKPGDLAVELAGLKVLHIALGRKAPKITHTPGADQDDLAREARRVSEEVGQGPAPKADRAAMRERLDKYLAGVEAGGTRTSRSEMQQLAFAAYALAADQKAAVFTGAYDALDAELAKPYDAAVCARLARAALAAGR